MSATPVIPQQLVWSSDEFKGRLISRNPDPSPIQTPTISKNEIDTYIIRRVQLTVNTEWAKINKTGNVRINVTLRRVRVSTAAVENQ